MGLNEIAHIGVDHLAPATATENAVVSSALYFQVLVVSGLDASAQVLGRSRLS